MIEATRDENQADSQCRGILPIHPHPAIDVETSSIITSSRPRAWQGSWDLSRLALRCFDAGDRFAPGTPLRKQPRSQTVVTTQDSASSADAAQDRHPKGLYILFASEMWERFGFYTAAAIMTLYLQRGGFGWSKTDATKLWSYYLMFVYATPLIGGWLADKFVGYRRSVLIGGIFFTAGYVLLGFGSFATYY